MRTLKSAITWGDDKLVYQRPTFRIGTAPLIGLLFIASLLAVEPATATGRDPTLSTAELLVDLARDHGLNCRGKQTPSDVLRIRTLLRAALRLDPSNTQACVWLYELARLDGRSQEATDMLGRLVTANPDNLAAFTNWIEAAPPDVQTVERRKTWLNGLLQQMPQPERQALIHVQSARLAHQQLDSSAAEENLQQALSLWPDCPETAAMILADLPADAPLQERLRANLRLLRTRPLDVDLVWQIGQLLDQNGFAEDARTFYEYALSVHEKLAPGWPLAVDRLLDLARNAEACGDDTQAADYAQRAVQMERGTYEADFYLYWRLQGRANPALLNAIKGKLARAFAEIKEPNEWAVTLVAQAAWFYCIIDPQPLRALSLAENVAQRAQGDAFAQRVLGWAQALNARTDDARRTLEKIAGNDPFAAYRLAAMLKEEGNETEAARVVSELKRLPRQGYARTLLESLNLPLPTTRPVSEQYPEVPAVLAEFDRRIFGFHADPQKYIQAGVKPLLNSLKVGQPWWIELSITNTGPFAVPLGPDGLINPVFLLSFKVEGDRTRDYPQLMTMSIDYARFIPPGETIRVWRTVDLGPLRGVARRTPQHLLSITLSAILDPQQMPQGWQASPLGFDLAPVPFLRLPANTDPEAWHARFQRLKGESPEAIFQTLEEFGELLGESQRAASQALDYKPQPIPADRVTAVLRSAISGESWELAVRGLEALQAAGLDRAMLDEGQRCLEHPHWAVRMMAVRLLARQGKSFDEQARKIANDDTDDLVRDMARSYLEPNDEP